MDVIIVDDQGTHLLIAQGERFAIIERRNNRLYSCHDGKRDSVGVDHISNIASLLDEDDWSDEAAATAAFDEIVSRGMELGRTLR